MVIKEWKDTIIFMHKIEKGEADKSYGIHVAKLAGLPNEVINKANKMLIKLESNQSEKKLNELEEFKDNFLSNNQNEFFLKELDALDADNISPREALDIIYKMKLLRQKNV
jgi:DNA mismatch repair protein MutS